MPAHRYLVIGALGAASMLCATVARGDWVVLKDGTRYQGKVIDESGVSVVADVIADGRRATKAFKKADVKEVIKEPLPKGFFEKETSTAPPAAPVPRQADDDEGELPGGSRLYYIDIPLVGVFGQDFDETGVEEALAAAKRRKVEHVVFTLDSPGGAVATASAIQNIMTKYDADFTYYVRVKSAISASLWVLVCADRVFFEDGANAGASVAFRVDVNTGSATVDAKMIAALSSELAARAEQKRRLPPLLVRAMVDQEVAVYTRKDSKTSRTIAAPAVPAGEDAKEWTELDSKTQVLALSKKQAMDLGFGEDWSRREVLTAEWKLASKVGEAAMKHSRDRVHDFAHCVELGETLLANATIASKTRRGSQYNDYDTEMYYYRDRTGNYIQGTRKTAAAEALYANRDRAAVKAWEEVRSGAKEILKLLKKHEQLGLTEQMKELKKGAEFCEEKASEVLR